jgi:peptidoglycan/xylan/chitin deacetylase (PgdA/CDA1 family)
MAKIESNKFGFAILSCLLLSGLTLGVFGWLIIPNSPQLFGKSIRRVKAKEKIVALTFDDGPNPPFTNQILDILKKYGVKATFFVVGERAERYPEVVKQVYTEGHALGNHTWSHKVLIYKSQDFIQKQIDSTDKLLRDLGYTGPIHFRSPKGMKLITLPRVLAAMNRPNILFDVVAWDWRCSGVNKIVENVLDSVSPGSIILLHDGDGDHNDRITDRSQTVAATEIIIKDLKRRGFRFVTISELLKS